jgi:hypothetical protein
MRSCQRQRRTRSRWLNPPLDQFHSSALSLLIVNQRRLSRPPPTTAPPFETRSIGTLVSFPACLFCNFRGLRSLLHLLCDGQSQFALQTSLKQILAVCWQIVLVVFDLEYFKFGKIELSTTRSLCLPRSSPLHLLRKSHLHAHPCTDQTNSISDFPSTVTDTSSPPLMHCHPR